ncbi:shikimate kinase [Paenibacillus thermoaerophilus]|uniref:Shikimate kinase n=1 Tax=Paenibacillus thermoaerophilus TaxID=1215385 RepID=A0ABW2V718_9BACL|nr:shikimate kinase [Paenibacillus thermoaerophilus]TMV18750.1 shikimate kinase [Paenibacillus thermoaerophilus]
MNNIVLVGFMGTGKSTVGRALAERLGWSFVDSDARIVEKAGVDIPSIFAASGESGFRELEREVIGELMAGCRQVVATGGGAVLSERNREAMLGGGFVVALLAERDVIIERVRGDANRPLLAGDLEARVDKLLAERAGAYDFAHLSIDTGGMTPEEAARVIAEAYAARRPGGIHAE